MWLLALLLAIDTTSRTVPVPQAPAESLQVTMAGAGDPVVLLPGLFGSAFGYRKLIPALTAAGYRAIVIEPLGIGSSGRPEHADYSLTAQADRVARVLNVLDVRAAVVVAHALGGSIAYRLAYRHPELVDGIVSLDGGPAEAATTRGFRRALRFLPWVKLFGGTRLVRQKIRGYMTAGSGDPSWVSDEVVDGYTAGAVRELDATLKAYLAMGRAREPERLEPNLGGVRCPVRLVVGGVTHEGGPTAAEVGLLARAVARFAVDTVPGAGHFVHEERPGAVVDAVDRVRGQGRGS